MLQHKFISLNKVRERTSLSKTHIYRLINEGRFPRQVPISERRIAFDECEVNAWLQARREEREDA